MHHDKKGKRRMLGNSQHDLTALVGPAPVARPSPVDSEPSPATKGAPRGAAKTDKQDKRRRREVIAAEFGRVSEALRHLHDQVGDLHRRHLDRAAGQSGLVAQISALGADQAQAQRRELSLEARVEALRLSLEGLRREAATITDTLADLAVAPDRDTALFALEDRIQDAEATIADLRALLDQTQGEVGRAEAWTADLATLRQGLAAQGERLSGVEGTLAQDAAHPAATRLEQALTTLGASLDGRILALERDLATLRDQNRRWREAERSWAEARLHGLRRGLAGGIGLLALLLLGGVTATWWHGERQLDLIADRMAAVEPGANARFNALADPLADALADLGAARVADRLAPALGQLGAALQGIQASTEVLGARMAALSIQDQSARPSVARLPAAQAAPQAGPRVSQSAGATDSLGEPPSENRDQGPSPQGAPTAPDPVQVEPAAAGAPLLDSGRFTLQLIGFRDPARVAAFARDEGISGEARWLRLRTTGKGRPWYIVVLGDHGTRAEARAALAALPPRLKNLSPMIRPLAAGTALMPIQ